MAQSKSRSAGGPRPYSKRSASPKRSPSRSGSSSGDSSGSRSRASSARQASPRKSSPSSKRSTARRGSSRSGGSTARGSNGRGRGDAVKQAVTSGAHSTKDTLTGSAQNTKDTLASGAKTAGDALGGAAQKAKGPALAGGAALVGLAGGLAIAGRSGRRRVLGVPVPGSRRPLVKVAVPRRTRTKVRGKDLIKAAGEVGSAGRQFGELAGEVRMVRQQLDAKRRRSPVEVVLEGLTARRPPD